MGSVLRPLTEEHLGAEVLLKPMTSTSREPVVCAYIP